MTLRRTLPFVLALLGAGCTSSNPTPTDAGNDLGVDVPRSGDAASDSPSTSDGGITSVAMSERWEIPGLHGEVQVLRTEGGVPHIYARDREDLARVQGFVVARDRYFMLDLSRRYAEGTVSALFGDAAFNTDAQNRGAGMAYVTDALLRSLNEDEGRRFDAFAAGINAYVAEARDGTVAPPSEYAFAAPLLGRRNAGALMENFTRRDVVAMGVTFLYQSGFETGDVDRARAAQNLPGDFTGQALSALRRAGALGDIWNRLAQPAAIASAAGWGLETDDGGRSALDTTPHDPPAMKPPAAPRIDLARGVTRTPPAMLAALERNLHEIQRRLQRDHEEGFGSNAWAVMGRHTRDGAALLAADGHLPLTVPTLFYQIGLDTQVLGGGDIHQVGLALPLIPLLAMGTNGQVAWGFTQLAGDITDWYREEITLDAAGLPQSSRFMGASRPLVRVDESYVVADIPALMSTGRTEMWPRWTTFDGRFLTAVEGRRVTRTEALAPGESRVMLLGEFYVPQDMDHDGVITAVSFDYVGLDAAGVFRAYDGFGHAHTVQEFRTASRGLVATSLNQIAADAQGSVYYAGWQAVPCRRYLMRNPDQSWGRDSDPSRLLDGTRYGGFHIPVTDGVIDETMGASDPYQCVVPQSVTPAALDPARGYVVTANNEPGQITGDDSLTNDPWYIGGPWNDGFRGARIAEVLGAGVMAHNLDEEAMATLQADVKSSLGNVFTSVLLDAIATARTAAAGTPAAGTPEARMAARWRAAQSDYEAVETRVRAWSTAGYPARSGVETFYHQVDDAERAHSVATTLFNHWMGRFVRGVFDDERLPEGVWEGGNTTKIRTLRLMVEGRGAGNRNHLASFNDATQESAFFDVLTTPEVETSREVALRALDDALTALRAPPRGPGDGGFGPTPMDTWYWGLRHHVNFDSIVGSFLGSNDRLGMLTAAFAISPQRFVTSGVIPAGSPLAMLPGFPRPGDQWAVDAANSGLDGDHFTFGSGPTYRMVVALRRQSPDAMTGRNVVPGGQSGLTTSPAFDDQVRLWLGNRALPMQLEVGAVIAAARSREVYAPAP